MDSKGSLLKGNVKVILEIGPSPWPHMTSSASPASKKHLEYIPKAAEIRTPEDIFCAVLPVYSGMIKGSKMNSKVIGLDIGGANTKLASSDGTIVELHYLPLWKNTRLPEVLKEIAQRLQPEKVAIVMTGELADCFEDKEQGIRFIKS